jgi:hypothetical protein
MANVTGRHRWDHHPPCPGGCGNLADECGCARPNLLGSMTISEPIGSLPIHRTEAGWPNCSTCDGGGCFDCTDPA